MEALSLKITSYFYTDISADSNEAFGEKTREIPTSQQIQMKLLVKKQEQFLSAG